MKSSWENFDLTGKERAGQMRPATFPSPQGTPRQRLLTAHLERSHLLSSLLSRARWERCQGSHPDAHWPHTLAPFPLARFLEATGDLVVRWGHGRWSAMGILGFGREREWQEEPESTAGPNTDFYLFSIFLSDSMQEGHSGASVTLGVGISTGQRRNLMVRFSI